MISGLLSLFACTALFQTAQEIHVSSKNPYEKNLRTLHKYQKIHKIQMEKYEKVNPLIASL